MEVVTLIFALGIFGILAGAISMKVRSKAFAKSVSSCPACGKEVRISPDPQNSRLVLQCHHDGCGGTSFRQVRASALSLFGIARFVFVFPVVVLCYSFAERLEWNRWGRMFTTFAGLVVGWIIVSFLVRLCAFVLLRSCSSAILQNEIVAHLAPAPFLKKQEKKDNSSDKRMQETSDYTPFISKGKNE